MSAVQEAIERGTAAQGRKPKWEPVGVDHGGWLTARVRDLRSGEVEGVFYAQNTWQFRKLGRDKDDKVKSYNVRDRELKRIAKAMIGQGDLDMPEWREDLIREVAEARKEALASARAEKPKRRTRRKR